MNNKGYSLVELLAMIVIISILLVVAGTNVFSMIKKSKGTNYQVIEKTVKKAADNYIWLSDNNLKFNSRGVAFISLEDLKKYIGVIKDSDGNLCSGGVYVTSEENEILTSYVELECGNYKSSDLKDFEKPLITLKGSSKMTLEKNQNYIEFGAEAIDNVDGDITNKIKTYGVVNTNVTDKYSVLYSVIDSSGNVSNVVRTINVVDSIKPIIVLDREVLNISKGENVDLKDYIVSVTDSGKILDKEVSINPFNISNFDIGSYEIVYSVRDDYGNLGIESLILNVTNNFNNGVNNIPVLKSGMYPVKWNGSNFIVTSKSDPEWYLYNGDIRNQYGSRTNGIGEFSNDRWANVQISNENLKIGDVILESDLNLYVWIPRYTYKIVSNRSEGYFNTSRRKSYENIKIKYSKGKVDDLSGGYKSHPAFCVSNDSDGNCLSNNEWNLYGIWVMKYEASNKNNIPVSRPGFSSWVDISLTDAFYESRSIESSNIGLNSNEVDSHLIKNSEWSAVTYLTEAIRDGEEVWINNNKNFITGCAGNSVSSKSSRNCFSFETSKGVKASTTGNVYGIYDMSGGAREFVSSYINNNDRLLYYDRYNSYYGFTYFDLFFQEKKYRELLPDSYQSNNTLGLSLYETSKGEYYNNYRSYDSWYKDHSVYSSFYNGFMTRGGYYRDRSHAGIFGFYGNNGESSWYTSFRAVIVIN